MSKSIAEICPKVSLEYVLKYRWNMIINNNKQDKLIDPLLQSDVIDILTSNLTNKPLSANQGRVLSEKLTDFINRYNNNNIIGGDINFLGSGITWVNGYAPIANNPFPNTHSMVISQGNNSTTYNQLIVNAEGELLFKHSDDGVSFSDWKQCSTTTNVIPIDYMYVSKSGKMVTITCPSSAIYLTPGGLITTLPSGCAPSHGIKTFSTLVSNGTNYGTTPIRIDLNGNIYHDGTATGFYELCFTVSFLTK